MKDEYEGTRIVGKKETICNASVGAIVKILNVAVTQMPEPGEKACLLTGAAIGVLAGISFLFGPNARSNPAPTSDDIMFGSLYVAFSTESSPQGPIAVFSIESIKKALSMYKTITGREFKVNDALQAVLDEDAEKVKNINVSTDLRKFLPQ